MRAGTAPAATSAPRIGTGSLLALGVNGTVGVGIFFVPNVVAGLVPGPDGARVYLLTAALLLPIAVAFATLGRSLPTDGGPSVWARAAFGEFAGYAVGWVAAISALISTGAVLAGVGTHIAAALSFAVPSAGLLVACGCVALFGAIVAMGLGPSAWAWNVLTILKLLPLVLLVAAFAVGAGGPPPAGAPVHADYARGVLVALFPLQGFEAVAVLAGSARSGRSVLIGTVGALSLAAALYAAVHVACVSAVPALASTAAPLVAAARALGGASLERLVAVGTNVSALGIAFGMLVLTPRYVAALGTEAGLGNWLGRVDGRGVPRAALAATLLGVGALLVSARTVSVLLVLSSAAVLVQYLTALASLLRLSLRRRYGLSRRAAVAPLLGVFAVALLGSSLELRELVLLALALVSGGLAWAARRLAGKRAMTG